MSNDFNSCTQSPFIAWRRTKIHSCGQSSKSFFMLAPFASKTVVLGKPLSKAAQVSNVLLADGLARVDTFDQLLQHQTCQRLEEVRLRQVKLDQRVSLVEKIIPLSQLQDLSRWLHPTLLHTQHRESVILTTRVLHQDRNDH